MSSYTLPYVKLVASGKLLYHTGGLIGALWQPRGMGRGRGWERGSRRDISQCCRAETNITVKSL